MKPTTTIALRSDPATHDNDKVKLGDMAPAFKPSESKPVKRYIATEDSGKVRLGDFAPAF